MNRKFIGAFLAAIVFTVSGSAFAGGKPDGAKCHVHKSCQSKLCLREHPLDKFGECCDAQDCPSLGAQCGEIDNGCGTSIQCGECGPGNICSNNQCVQGTTTTTNTIPFNDSCAGFCGSNPPGGVCFCDTLSCDFGDGCADRDAECPNICNPPSTTTTTTGPTTTTTLNGCPTPACGNMPACDTDCILNQTPENTCGVCAASTSCDVQTCTASSDCNPGEVCVINTCCNTGSPSIGICASVCGAQPTTTTTAPPPPTSTTLAPTTTTTAAPTTTTTIAGGTTTTTLGATCAGRCGDNSGAGGCYCDLVGCGVDNCADVYSVCPEICGPTTTTTLNTSCAGRCGDSSGAGGCYCDSLGCGIDNCADVDDVCPEICAPPTTTTVPPPTTTSTTIP